MFEQNFDEAVAIFSKQIDAFSGSAQFVDAQAHPCEREPN
jgi:hypothetical protein